MSAQLIAGGTGLSQGRFDATELLTDLSQFALQPVDARSMLIGLLSSRPPGLLELLLPFGGRCAFAIDVQQHPAKVALVALLGRLGGVALLSQLPLKTKSRFFECPLKFTSLLRCLFNLAFKSRSRTLLPRQISAGGHSRSDHLYIYIQAIPA